MPRLSLYRPEKSKDYKFIDRTVYEQFQVGGVDVHVHKYIGTVDGDTVKDHTQIQDLLFLENRDRKYDSDIFVLRGHYQTQDVDFNLSQFGLFLQNDTVFLTVHINNSVDLLGRKIISGDVLELPNLKDEYALNDLSASLKRFYVVEDVNRSAEGFSAVWYPHLYRVKLKPIVDSQEFKDILDRPMNTDMYAGDFNLATTYYPGQVVKYKGDLFEVNSTVSMMGTTLAPPDTVEWQAYSDNTMRDLMSTYEREMQINNAVVAEAEGNSPLSGYETSHFYSKSIDPVTGKTTVISVDDTSANVASSLDVSAALAAPVRDGYVGYLLEDGFPPNGGNSAFGFGIQFPPAAISGDSFLRTDYMPSRLFKYDGNRWVKQEDNVRMTLSNTDTRQTLKTSFINNTAFSGINKLATDVISISAAGTPAFETGGVTVAFAASGAGYVVTTNVNYVNSYIVEAWLNENGQLTNLVTAPSNGKLVFTIPTEIENNTQIRYSIYESAIAQRQAVSKALRKIKPEADA